MCKNANFSPVLTYLNRNMKEFSISVRFYLLWGKIVKSYNIYIRDYTLFSFRYFLIKIRKTAKFSPD